MSGSPRILVVEDSPGDRRLAEEALRHTAPDSQLVLVGDGMEAMDYLHSADEPLPDLILLDLNMPRKDGREVLSEIKSDPVLRTIPVVVLTTSESGDDIRHCYMDYANSYVTKPLDVDRFITSVESIVQYWMRTVELPSRVAF